MEVSGAKAAVPPWWEIEEDCLTAFVLPWTKAKKEKQGQASTLKLFPLGRGEAQMSEEQLVLSFEVGSAYSDVEIEEYYGSSLKTRAVLIAYDNLKGAQTHLLHDCHCQ